MLNVYFYNLHVILSPDSVFFSFVRTSVRVSLSVDWLSVQTSLVFGDKWTSNFLHSGFAAGLVNVQGSIGGLGCHPSDYYQLTTYSR